MMSIEQDAAIADLRKRMVRLEKIVGRLSEDDEPVAQIDAGGFAPSVPRDLGSMRDLGWPPKGLPPLKWDDSK